MNIRLHTSCLLLFSASAVALHAHNVGERITSAAALDEGASYVLVNKATGGVIDSAGRTVTNLANLIPAVHDGSTFQMWRVVEQSNGSFYIFNRANDKVILVDGGSKEVGANIVQDRNRNSQRNAFYFESAADGYFRLVNVNSNLPLAVSAAGTGAGVNIEQAAAGGGDAQLWAVHRAEAPFAEEPDFSMRGFATVGAGVTGGAGGEMVIVSTVDDLKHYISRPLPTIVLVDGVIDLPSNPDTPHSNPSGRMYTVSSNKTIIGLPGARIQSGGFNISRVSNIIIRNLTFGGAADDCINIEHGSTRVWIDHNEFFAGFDGLVDVKRESDFITVSWNIFHEHDKTALLGHDDNHTADRGHLRVTYHHNWFKGGEQRHPRVRYARTHIFNNFYEDIGGYGIGIGVEAQIISESNFIESANSGYRRYDKASQPGFFRDTNSVFSGLNNDLDETEDHGIDWSPAAYYGHTVTHVLNVPDMVRTYAGVGVLTTEELGIAITPPVITQGFASRTANIGTTTTFSLIVEGTGPFTYAWTHNGNPVGGNAASLTLSNIFAADAGTYAVTVSNGFGDTATTSAVLTVDTTVLAPVFENAPANQVVQAGGTAMFDAGANGTAPLVYVWRKDGIVIPGQNSPTLVFSPVSTSDAAFYTVTVSNDGGSITSAPFLLAVPPAPPAAILEDTFADGNRSGQSLPTSAAWFTSSGTSNFTATVGAATQSVGSSRTLLAYFTGSSASPVQLAVNEELIFEFDFRLSGFDSGQSADTPTLRAALLRSVANPTATSGTGFTASGSPNTQARVNGDFGSNNPTNNPFSIYEGYAAFAAVQAAPGSTGGYIGRRDEAHPALLGNAGAFTQVGTSSGPPAAMQANTPYQGRLAVRRQASGNRIDFSITRISDGAVVMAYTAHDTSGGPTAFDSVAFHLSKAGSSPTYNFVINRGHVRRESLVDTDTFDGWMVASGLPTALRGRAAMPFNDGMPNLLKYALGLDPLAPATSGPLQMISESGQEPYLSLAFTRRTVPGDVTLTVQTASHLTFSGDLGSMEVSVTPNGNGSEHVIVRSAASLSAQPTQFMRLLAE